MPELPEVETTRAGLEPQVTGRRVLRVEVRDRRLRWPIAPDFEANLTGQYIVRIRRRAKYLLLDMAHGTLLIHLGMSGSLQVVELSHPVSAHEHVDLVLDSGTIVRYRDPRRFGCMIWIKGEPEDHPLLNHLGPEPLGNAFSGVMLFERSRGRKSPIKNFIMDAKVVVGVGNIYASESLYMAKIHPNRQAGRVSLARFDTLAETIRQVLRVAIDAGGTTLREYFNSEGGRGAYGDRRLVYGKEGAPCPACQRPIRQLRIGQRSSFYCASCQR